MKCRRCNRVRETATASRYGGGNYRRAGRWYRSQICLECASRLLETATHGHTMNERWDLFYVRVAAKDLLATQNKKQEDPNERTP